MLRANDIVFSRMGRSELIQYCERLRAVLREADPVRWVDEANASDAALWEQKAEQVLNREG